MAIYGAFERLLITEGDRRRVRVDLEDVETGEDEAPAEVVNGYGRSAETDRSAKGGEGAWRRRSRIAEE